MKCYMLVDTVYAGHKLVTDQVIDVPEAVATRWREKGLAEIVLDEGDAGTPFEKMSVAQMKEYAAENGIDLGAAALKADIMAAIVAAGTHE